MPPRHWERFRTIDDGNAGALQTLAVMRGMIQAPEASVTRFVQLARYHAQRMPGWDMAPAATLAGLLFQWVCGHVLYMPDVEAHGVIEEIRTPGYQLDEIARLGHTLGDCDDYVVLLGALYRAAGLPIRMVALSQFPDQKLDHVYLEVETELGWTAADGIAPHPFGWQVPAAERTAEITFDVP